MKPVSVRVIIIAFTAALSVSILPGSDAMHSIFQTLDLNGDGKIEFKEFSKDMTEFAFNKIDDNDNQVITKNEWEIVMNVTDRDKHDELFKDADTGNDQSISFEEFSNYARIHSNIKEAFMSLDKNSDGFLFPDEISSRPPFRMVTLQY
jgi:Ca2+-binding EF-hand superfamily protein